MTSPLQAYKNAINSMQYEHDPAQANAMEVLEALYRQVNTEEKQRHRFSWFRQHFAKHGVYLYGAVGAGKTWMMDMFYECLEVKKQRYHFHQFMREIHQELKILQGHKDPLKRIAKHLAHKAKVICFDELFVNDITDAMLLGELFKFMFLEGITFVMTSNVPPELLYRNGLQRSRFYPAIQLLNDKMQLVQVQSLKDYRWRHAMTKGVYFSPLDEASHMQINALFNQLSLGEVPHSEPLHINSRAIEVIKYTQDVLWCHFDKLCHVPRSVQDYVSLTKKFKAFIIDELPIIAANDDNAIWYWISLVDVLYDARCRLIIRAEALAKDIYQGSKLGFEYQRTLSRLAEMQTEEYWI